MMKKPALWLALIAVFFVAGFAAVRMRSGDTPTYQEAEVKEGPFSVKVQASATVAPENRILVVPPVQGRIDKFLVDEGTVVKKGQVVAIMSSQDRVALMDSIHTLTKEMADTLKQMYKPVPLLAATAGLVVSRPVNEGQNVTPQDHVFEIANRLIIDAQVDESDIAYLKPDQKVDLVIDSFRDRTFHGKVFRIGHQAVLQNNVNTYEVLIQPDDIDLPIRSGMSVSTYFILNEKPKALLLPAYLAQGQQDAEIRLDVKGADGKPEHRLVKVGKSNGENVEIVAGLSAGEKVLYQPLQIEIQKNSFFGGAPKGK